MALFNKRRGLFLLHEGIDSTIFNSQVLEHVKDIGKHGFEFDILSFNTESKIWIKSNQNLNNIRKTNPELNIILKKGINIYYPFSGLINYLLLLIFIIRNRRVYGFIHARADYSAYLCILVQKIVKIKVIWDCRGDSLSELEDTISRKNKLIKFLSKYSLVPKQRHIIDVLNKSADAAIFVSDALYEIFKNKLSTNIIQIVPCSVSEKIFYFDEKLRKEGREKMGFDSEKTVFLYSGSMIGYQSLNLQYKIYENILADKNQIIVYATSDPGSAKEYFKNFPSDQFIIKSVPFLEMNSLLNIADLAILLRDDKQLNWVASPTKFGEYCLAGMLVILNDTVKQATINAHKIGNYVGFGDKVFKKPTDDQRRIYSRLAKDLYSREVLNIKYVTLYESIE